MQPEARIEAYFTDCGRGTAADIARHFTPDAVIYDTNVGPTRGSDAIGEMWVKVRERWNGATWRVDSFVGDGDHAAIEWSMRGRDSGHDRPFTFRGSEHYVFDSSGSEPLIGEIRQYWTFDRVRLDTGLLDYPYPAPYSRPCPESYPDGT